jgi:hypothetical protein
MTATTSATATVGLVLALDLGKYKSAACAYDPDWPAQPRFAWAVLWLNGFELMHNTASEDDERPPAPDPARIANYADKYIC